MLLDFFFFFQAEDGIRDTSVTGVQTCALPISRLVEHADERVAPEHPPVRAQRRPPFAPAGGVERMHAPQWVALHQRSEERRVGEERRVRCERGRVEASVTMTGAEA